MATAVRGKREERARETEREREGDRGRERERESESERERKCLRVGGLIRQLGEDASPEVGLYSWRPPWHLCGLRSSIGVARRGWLETFETSVRAHGYRTTVTKD